MAEDKGHAEQKHGKHKKHHHDDHGGEHEEGVPEWMVSFADNVCLMMGFFVIMLAMNMKPAHGGSGTDSQDGSQTQTPPNALLDAAIAIRAGFNNPVDLSSSRPEDQPLVRRLREKSGTGKATQPGVSGPKDTLTTVRPTDYYSLSGVVPFTDGATDLSPTGRKTVAAIAEELKGPTFIIELRGHVSSAEVSQQVEAGMLISHKRALSVARGLAENGIPWARMRIVACGDSDRRTPIAYDAAAHRTNQRVEVIVTKETMADDPFLRDLGASQAPTVEPQVDAEYE